MKTSPPAEIKMSPVTTPVSLIHELTTALRATLPVIDDAQTDARTKSVRETSVEFSQKWDRVSLRFREQAQTIRTLLTKVETLFPDNVESPNVDRECKTCGLVFSPHDSDCAEYAEYCSAKCSDLNTTLLYMGPGLRGDYLTTLADKANQRFFRLRNAQARLGIMFPPENISKK